VHEGMCVRLERCDKDGPLFAGYVESVECEDTTTRASSASSHSGRTPHGRTGGAGRSGMEICACCTVIHGGGGWKRRSRDLAKGRVGNLPFSFGEGAPKQKGSVRAPRLHSRGKCAARTCL
jgi:hypothetical protein